MNDTHSGKLPHSKDSPLGLPLSITRKQNRFQMLLPGFVGVVSCLGLVSAEAASEPDAAVQLDAMTVTGNKEQDARILDYSIETAAVGTKTDTPLLETPQSISVVTGDQIVLRNAQGVAEALRYTAGTSTETYGPDPRGYDWVTIRGFDAFNSRYLDGLRLQNYEFPEIFGLERVEVMKGPSSVLYGQSTAGGLINAISKRPKDFTFGEIGAEIGTHESYEATADFGGPLTKDGSVLYRFTGLFKDNQKDSTGFPVDARRYYIAPAFTWKISPDTKIDFLFSYFHTNSTQVPSFAAAPNGAPTNVRAFGYDKWDFEKNDILRMSYQLEHAISPDLKFRQNFNASSYDVKDKYVNSLGYSSGTVMDRSASIWNSDTSAVGLDSQLEYKLRSKRVEQTFLFGFDYSYATADTQYYEDAAPGIDINAPDYSLPIPVPTTLLSDSYQKVSQYGLYAQDQIKLDSKWVGTFSVRQDWAESDLKERTTGGTHDRQKDDAFTGRAGITYLADNGLAPYASYSTSFYPNSGTDSSGNTFDPTEGRQYEIGLKYAPKNFRGGATLSVFDLTQTNNLTTDPANTAFNKASGEWRSRGIEFEGNLGITENLDLLVNASYDDVEITRSEDGDQGNTPGLTPEKSASAWLNYTFHDGTLKGLTLGAGVRYVGPSYSSNYDTARNEDYAVVDLAARYVNGPWIYALNVNNLFDDVEWISTDYQYNKTAGNSVNLSVAYHW